MSVWLSELGLRNFKCFRDQTLPLGRLTLLTGLNGGGKSSVIQSLLALRQSHVHGLMRGPSSELALNGDYARLGTGQDVLCESGNDEEGIGITLTWSDRERADWTFVYAKDGEVLAASQAPTQLDSIIARPPFAPTTARQDLKAPATEYVSADRLTPRTAFAMSDYRVGARGVGPKGEWTAHFLVEFGDQAIPIPGLALREDFHNITLLRQVEAWLRRVSPGVVLELEPIRSLDTVKLRFAFDSQYGRTNAFRPLNVGFGITYCLPVLTAVLAASPGSLVVLENPEAHLHPLAQFRLAELLCEAAHAGVQIIVESHSDHILNGLRVSVHKGKVSPDSVVVHFFERPSGEDVSRVQSPRINKHGRFDRWPKSFFDTWEAALDQLLDD